MKLAGVEVVSFLFAKKIGGFWVLIESQRCFLRRAPNKRIGSEEFA